MLKALETQATESGDADAVEPVPFRIHDLRRTAASGMPRLGFQPHIIERVLNHVSGVTGGLVGVYQRYEYLDDRKAALEAWANGTPPAERFAAGPQSTIRQTARLGNLTSIP